MLKFPGLRRSETAAPRTARFRGPEDELVYAIGDIHGCRAELDLLLGRITDELSDVGRTGHLIFLGDYIDRGPDSAGVLDRLVEGPIPGSRQSFLAGNHEEALLAILDGDIEALNGWLRYGGLDTLRSYGIDRAAIVRLGSGLAAHMLEIIPSTHVDFLRACADYVQAGDYLFVHAGIRPGIPIGEQDSADLRWIRSGFLDDDQSNHGVMVVHGHSVAKEPEIRSNRIGIDTGCYRTGRLTALVIDGRETRFLST